MDVMRYAVILERGPSSWGAHVPDLPGCVAVGESEADVLERIRQAVPEHIKALQEEDYESGVGTSGTSTFDQLRVDLEVVK